MNEIIVTTLVSRLADKQRPYSAELRVDGYPVEKSYHATLELAWEWCDEKKAKKLKEVSR